MTLSLQLNVLFYIAYYFNNLLKFISSFFLKQVILINFLGSLRHLIMVGTFITCTKILKKFMY
jgi:hypothetical protein